MLFHKRTESVFLLFLCILSNSLCCFYNNTVLSPISNTKYFDYFIVIAETKNTRIYEYMIAVAEEGTVINAARRCFISHPALSQHMKALEKSYGFLLF